jgi:three-Cys-motif partner protein
MAKGGYKWSIEDPQPLGEHSKAKHGVYREYLRRYLRERIKSPRFDKFPLNIVDGFAGGGIYVSGRDRAPYYGSPIILLRTLQEMQAELQAQQRKDFLLDYRVHLVDEAPEAIVTLRQVLAREGFGSLIGKRVFLHNRTFQDALPSLVQDVQGRGRTLFILDQYGYKDVPFELLSRIFRELRSPEVILTFAFDHLSAFVQDYKALNSALGRIGMAALPREEYDVALSQPGGLAFLIQRRMHGAFLSTAGFYTPFFVTSRGDGTDGSRGSNLAYWLLHLSAHPLARDVMTGLHWERHNHFAHFGGAGSHMLGYDPAQAPGEIQAFMFDDDARARTTVALGEDLPREIARHPDGIDFSTFHSAICNGSPADASITKKVLANLARNRIIEIKTPTGSMKRNLESIRPDDRLILPRQTTLILPTKVAPIFARQPGGSVR